MSKSVEYYLSKGLDEKTAGYFASGRKKPVGVVANNDYTLTITFNNGETRKLDIKPIIKNGTVFEFLFDQRNFIRAYVDKNGAVAWDIDPDVNSESSWNNKVDLDPDRCYMDSTPL